MKDFFKNVFATVVGIALFFAIVGFFGFISIIGMLASGDSAVKVKDNSVLVLNLKGALQERAEDDIMAQVMGEVNGSSLGLDDILEAISKAKDNDNVKGIYIESGAFGSDSPASNHAIREALLDFKKSGKWIVAYGDQYIQSASWPMATNISRVPTISVVPPTRCGLIPWERLTGTDSALLLII